MAYWLLKSEPSAYSWQQMVKDGSTSWTGVRNYTARNNLQAMKKGDQAFFYHSGEGKEIVGVVEIAGPAAPDPTDKTGAFVMVKVKAGKALKKPLALADIKKDTGLKNMVFVKQSRLSVSPVTEKEWKRVMQITG